MNKLKVLVTGMCGRIGTVIGEKLNQDFEFTSLDLTAKQGFKSFTGDLSKLEEIQSKQGELFFCFDSFFGTETCFHHKYFVSDFYFWEFFPFLPLLQYL